MDEFNAISHEPKRDSLNHIIVYISTVSGNIKVCVSLAIETREVSRTFFSILSGEIKSDQQYIFNVLESKKIQFDFYDVAAERFHLDQMKELSGRQELPQIFNGEKFCGVRQRESYQKNCN